MRFLRTFSVKFEAIPTNKSDSYSFQIISPLSPKVVAVKSTFCVWQNKWTEEKEAVVENGNWKWKEFCLKKTFRFKF